MMLFGIDPGKKQDPTAIVVTQLRDDGRDQASYEVLAVSRLRLRTSYTELPPIINNLINHDRFYGDSGDRYVVVDASGVGEPVTDMLRFSLKVQRGFARLIPIVITAGDTVTETDHGYNVPKSHLITTAQAVLGQERIKIGEGAAAAPLLDELATFQTEQLTFRQRLFGARPGAHDDLVLALSYTLWYGEKRGPQRGCGIWIML